MGDSFFPMVETDPANVAGILTFSQVGDALAVPELAVERLVARRRIPAILVGGNGRRITVDALKKYANDGAYDLRGMPNTDNRWFTDGYSADQFAERLASMAKADIPRDLGVLRRLVENSQAGYAADTPVEITLALNDNMKKALSAPAGDSMYTSAGEEFAASRLRGVAKKVINDSYGFTAKPIDNLYADRESYGAITSAALAKLRTLPAFSFTSFVVMPNSAVGRPTAVSWVLPMSVVLDAVGGDLIARAF